MKRFVECWGLAILLLFTANAPVACSDDDPTDEGTETPAAPSDEGTGGNGGNNGDNNGGDGPVERHIAISVNGTPFTATLEDNEAGQAFTDMLPLTLNMSEMNGNEKYCYLDASLPVESLRPGTIRAGDLMLYGSSCVVLFYETFSSGYSYTRLGRIDNPQGLAAAAGSGNASVGFAAMENTVSGKGMP